MNYTFLNMRNKLFLSFILTVLVFICSSTAVLAQDNIDAYFEKEYEGSTNYYRTEPRTKKGLQEAYSYSGAYVDLGIGHTLVNVCINELLDGNVKHIYNGRTYYFNYIPNLSTDTVREFNKNDVCVTAVLLLKLDSRSRSANIIYPGALINTNKLFYGWNVYDAKAVETLAALLDFLASTYGQEQCHIDNWIVGNEVNMPNAWNYVGTTNVTTNVDIAARSFVLVNNAIKRYNSGAKAYLSLDHSWTHNDEGRGIAGKTFLDAFAARVNELSPDIDWNLAFHPYAPIMTDSNIWNSWNALRYTPVNINADFISARNLGVLTDYVKETYGEKVRIILSEQGFTVYNGQEAKQAAALAYTYYAAEFNDMIDATMFRALKDHSTETKDHFYFGLLNSDGSKRMSYDVFKYMDTDEWETYTKVCLDTIGISLWNELITYFDGERFVRKPLEEINVIKDGTVLAVGARETLVYEVYPEFADSRGIKWISDDETIVSIDANSGEMTGISPGRTVVMAVHGDVDFDTCVVVVKDAEECLNNIGRLVDEVYVAVTGDAASEEDRFSYSDRIRGRYMTVTEMIYEVIKRKEALTPSETIHDYVKEVYRAVLGVLDEDIPGEDIQKYAECIEAGMDKARLFIDLVSSTEFEYRCYDFDAEMGSIDRISEIRDINRFSYNRNIDITYYAVSKFKMITGKPPKEAVLMEICSRLLQKNTNKSDVIKYILNLEASAVSEMSNEEFVDLMFNLSDIENANMYVKTMVIRFLNNGQVTREQVIEEILKLSEQGAAALRN